MNNSSSQSIRLTVDGVEITGRDGQTIAGAMMAAGLRSWRTTARDRRPRGLFCGIGVCFDCLVTVNGVRDVRACQRRAQDLDVVDLQSEPRPGQEAADG
jgi:predicted molibdopterin-dependent oxidoreductase YjgC